MTLFHVTKCNRGRNKDVLIGMIGAWSVDLTNNDVTSQLINSSLTFSLIFFYWVYCSICKQKVAVNISL